MASRLTRFGGTMKTKMKTAGTDVHWQEEQGPNDTEQRLDEQSLQELLEGIRTRVSVLKETVEEQSKLINQDIDSITLDEYGNEQER
jgi:hypothetical protein